MTAILDTLPRSNIDRPFAPKIIILGQDGVGKTTAAGAMPRESYWFVGDDFEVPTSLSFEPITYQPSSFQDLLEKLNIIATGELGSLKSVIFDNIEHIFSLFDEYVVSEGGAKIQTIADFGHGKGYVAQENCLDKALEMLQRINDRGVSILMLGHTQQTVLTNANGEDYIGNKALIRDKLYKKISAWCNISGFAYRRPIVRDKKVTGHLRMVRWDTVGSSDGKNRHDLPSEMEFDLAAALKMAKENKETHKKLIRSIPALIKKLPTESQVKAELTLSTTIGLDNLKAFHEKLLKRIAETNKTKEK